MEFRHRPPLGKTMILISNLRLSLFDPCGLVLPMAVCVSFLRRVTLTLPCVYVKLIFAQLTYDAASMHPSRSRGATRKSQQGSSCYLPWVCRWHVVAMSIRQICLFSISLLKAPTWIKAHGDGLILYALSPLPTFSQKARSDKAFILFSPPSASRSCIAVDLSQGSFSTSCCRCHRRDVCSRSRCMAYAGVWSKRYHRVLLAARSRFLVCSALWSLPSYRRPPEESELRLPRVPEVVTAFIGVPTIARALSLLDVYILLLSRTVLSLVLCFCSLLLPNREGSSSPENVCGSSSDVSARGASGDMLAPPATPIVCGSDLHTNISWALYCQRPPSAEEHDYQSFKKVKGHKTEILERTSMLQRSTVLEHQGKRKRCSWGSVLYARIILHVCRRVYIISCAW